MGRRKNKRKSQADYAQPLEIFEDDMDVSSKKAERGQSAMEDDDSDPEPSGTALELNLPSESESSDDDEEEEEESSSEEDEADVLRKQDEKERHARSMKAARRAEERISKDWGKKKSAYYDADTKDFEMGLDEDKEAAQEEEEEALRLQQERAEELSDDDFELDELLGTSSSSSKSSSSKASSSLAAALNTDMDAAELAPQVDVEKLEKSVESLTKEQRLELIARDSPELLELLKQFKDSLNAIRTQIKPLLDRVKGSAEPAIRTHKGVSFLELKHQLLLNYCANISFYLMLKAQGLPVANHPVVSQLVELRVVLDKLRPMDKKLRYQINKLLRAQSSTAAPSSSSSSTSAAAAPASASRDLLSFKPDPKELMDLEDEVMDEDDASNIYKPSRLIATQYEDPTADKRNKKRTKLARKVAGSSMLADLQRQVSDAPEEITDAELFGFQQRAQETKDSDERTEFEEENFIRLLETKKDKQRRKRAAAALEQSPWDDLADMAHLSELASSLNESGSAEQQSRKELQKYRQEKARQRKERERQQADEFYNSVANKSKSKKRARAEAYAPQEYTYQEQDPDLQATGKRQVSYDILKNKTKGIGRYRSKISKNPRTRKREQYRKALIKRRSTVQEYKGQETMGYGGQKTGIKANVVRSTSLK